MCFPRKPSLGRYNATRKEWLAAYRSARINAREGRDPNPANSGVTWKAELIVAYERGEMDRLTLPLEARRPLSDEQWAALLA